ncbi:hypothetical protein [Pseudomonas sp. RA_5y_Pfl1_P24]|uniref:hypothetical protein n=1 Tax=Pseudomonas sp. RA_5y_Pfl1_P24 TaxID=3088706 RepID=UPI0030D87A99
MEGTVETQAEDRRRAWSYNGAVEAGFEPQSYSWKDLPVGVLVARLDFKIWSNKTAAGCLGCYFTSLVDGRRYQLSAFRPYRSTSRRYSPTDEGIDFSQPGLDGQTFLLEVGKSANGKIKWLSAEFQE